MAKTWKSDATRLNELDRIIYCSSLRDLQNWMSKFETQVKVCCNSILHDWSDEHSAKFLKNCYKALPANGKVIIVELILLVLPENNVASHGVFQLDNIMLAHNPGGKERTEKEFEALAKGAGFNGFKVLLCAYSSWVMEFNK